MRQVVLIMAMVVALSGCGKIDRGIAHWTGHSEMCIDGVKYIQFSSGASVKYDTDGHVVKC